MVLTGALHVSPQSHGPWGLGHLTSSNHPSRHVRNTRRAVAIIIGPAHGGTHSCMGMVIITSGGRAPAALLVTRTAAQLHGHGHAVHGGDAGTPQAAAETRPLNIIVATHVAGHSARHTRPHADTRPVAAAFATARSATATAPSRAHHSRHPPPPLRPPWGRRGREFPWRREEAR